MSDKERLAEIIKNNPGATLRVDNDHWYFVRTEPAGFSDLSETEQEEWWENHSVLCESRDFPDLGTNGGYGVLETMCSILNINVEGV